MDSKIIDFWETCDSHFAHLNCPGPGYFTKGSDLEKHYKNMFIDKIDFSGKHIIDYGCGGGWVGKYLIDFCGIKKYTGIDISNRSRLTAKFNIKNDIAEFKNIDSSFDCDIFMSLACIQHFDSKETLDNFLNKLNKSSARTIILQIKYSEQTQFNDDIAIACLTNEEYISNMLDSFVILNKSEVDEKLYQYLIWSRA